MSDGKTRQGFYLGDGTGTGKTRTLAGIVYEYSKIGDKRAIWMTASPKLFKSVQEELSRFFGSNIEIVTMKSLLAEHEYDDSRPAILLLSYGDFIDSNKMIRKRNKNKGEELDCDDTDEEMEDPSQEDNGSNNLGEIMLKLKSMGAKLNLIVRWMEPNFNGLIILDDCHFAKAAGYIRNPSRTGKIVVTLQEAFPEARVVYSSATGASETRHLMYLSRLGLWGVGTSYATVQVFKEALDRRGVGAMELLAMELKLRGVFVARQLSYDGVTIANHDVVPNPIFEPVYNRCCQLGQLMILYVKSLKEKARLVREMIGKPAQGRQGVFNDGPFYSSSLTFFSMMMMSSKMFTIEQIARKALKEDKSVIIGLQTTGEHKFNAFLGNKWNDGMPYSVVREILRENLMSMGVEVGCTKVYLNDGNVLKIGEWTEDDEKTINRECKNKWLSRSEMDLLARYGSAVKLNNIRVKGTSSNRLNQDAGIASLSEWPMMSIGWYVAQKCPKHLKSPETMTWSYNEVKRNITPEGLARMFHEVELLLPINPLDEIRSRLTGILQHDIGYEVAEMTGRRFMYEYDHTAKCWKTKIREDLNTEMSNFMEGCKRVCLISNIASTGFNLHSDVNCSNRQKRVHITVELPYGPDRLLQQLGRSHRFNQVHLPEYHIVQSVIPGEIRFLSVANKRLRQLGAICCGQSMASPFSAKMSDILCNHIGANAVDRAVKELYRDTAFAEWAESVGLLLEERNVSYDSKTVEERVSKAFNRSLMLPIFMQNEFMKLVTAKLEAILKYEDGYYYSPLVEIPGRSGRVKLVSRVNLETSVGVCRVEKFLMDRTCNWEHACRVRKKAKKQGLKCKYMTKQRLQQVALVITGDDGKESAVFPWNVLPTTVCTKDWIGWKKESNRDKVECRWTLFEEKVKNTPGCIHRSDWNGCSRHNCTLQWGTYHILIISGFTGDILSYVEQFYPPPLSLARVSYSEGGIQQQTAGILIKHKNTTSFENTLLKRYKIVPP